jgi:hypothetical protein
LPNLIITAGCLALNDKLFRNRQQRQENINVHIVISQMTDADRSCTGLRCVVPNDVTITRIAACSPCIGAIKEKI